MRIYTVGHFDYSLDKFQEMLQNSRCDIRDGCAGIS